MDSFTLKTILVNLPTLLTIWTTLTLSWGVYVMVMYCRMIRFARKFKKGCRQTDITNVKCMLAFNVILLAYLCIEPYIVIGDAITVMNTFYTFYLLPSSITIARWWLSRPTYSAPPPEAEDDHALT